MSRYSTGDMFQLIAKGARKVRLEWISQDGWHLEAKGYVMMVKRDPGGDEAQDRIVFESSRDGINRRNGAAVSVLDRRVSYCRKHRRILPNGSVIDERPEHTFDPGTFLPYINQIQKIVLVA